MTFSRLFLPKISPSSLFYTLIPPPKKYYNKIALGTPLNRHGRNFKNIINRRQPETQGMVRPWWSNSISKRKLEIPHSPQLPIQSRIWSSCFLWPKFKDQTVGAKNSGNWDKLAKYFSIFTPSIILLWR